MNSYQFRVLMAERYEEAATKGGAAAHEALEWLKVSVPVPEPWWVAAVVTSLIRIEEGLAPSEPTPEEFRRFETYEAERSRYWRATAWRAWIPYASGDPRFEEHRRRFDAMILGLLGFVADSSDLDDQAAPLLARSLSTALRADPSYRLPPKAAQELRRLVDRLEKPRCLPTDERFRLAAQGLRKIADYWERAALDAAHSDD